jgi:hypothetical protein
MPEECANPAGIGKPLQLAAGRDTPSSAHQVSARRLHDAGQAFDRAQVLTRAHHVAFMLHGPAVTSRNPLKLLVTIWDSLRHEKWRARRPFH